MQIIIFNVPQRNIDKLLLECNAHPVKVIDSVDTYGKKNFWKRYKQAVDYCKASPHDWFLFIPDDIINIDFGFLNQFMIRYYGKPIVLNITSDYREHCWGKVYQRTNDIEFHGYTLKNQGFFDCGGLISRAALEQIDIDPVPEKWFNSPFKSSGVGFQLTTKLRRLNIAMYRPYPSLAAHGDHESIMHPEERKRNPLISQ